MKNKNTLLEEEWNLGEHAHIHQTATTLHLDLNMSSCAQCHQNNLEKSLCAGTNLQACDLQTLRQQSIKHRRDSVIRSGLKEPELGNPGQQEVRGARGDR